MCGLDVNKVCSSPGDVGPNPVIDNTDYESFLTKFDVTISKSGPGALFDPSLRETPTFDDGETCRIIAIDNCASGAPTLPIVNFDNGDPVQVCDNLATTPITVRIECDTFANGFINSVTAEAATSDNGPKTLTASDTMTQAEVCNTQVNPALSVNKICHDNTANHADPTRERPKRFLLSHSCGRVKIRHSVDFGRCP